MGGDLHWGVVLHVTQHESIEWSSDQDDCVVSVLLSDVGSDSEIDSVTRGIDHLINEHIFAVANAH